MPTPKRFLQFNGELPGSGPIIEYKSVAAVHCVQPPSEHQIIHICIQKYRYVGVYMYIDTLLYYGAYVFKIR